MQIGLALAQTLLDVFVALTLFLASLLPACCMLLMQVRMRDDPAMLRAAGIVVTDTAAFDAPGTPVGRYQNAPIFAEVAFKGMRYSYDRIVPATYRDRIRPDELFQVPGIVYTARDR